VGSPFPQKLGIQGIVRRRIKHAAQEIPQIGPSEAEKKAIRGWKLAQGINANLPAGFTHALETDNTVNLSKQRVVLTHPHVLAWMKLCAHLPHQNIAGSDSLTAKALDATPLGGAVPTVS